MRRGLDPSDPLILAMPPGECRQAVVDVLTGAKSVWSGPMLAPPGARVHWYMSMCKKYADSALENRAPFLATRSGWQKIKGEGE
jgi:hypothetical protein